MRKTDFLYFILIVFILLRISEYFSLNFLIENFKIFWTKITNFPWKKKIYFIFYSSVWKEIYNRVYQINFFVFFNVYSIHIQQFWNFKPRFEQDFYVANFLFYKNSIFTPFFNKFCQLLENLHFILNKTINIIKKISKCIFFTSRV